MKDNAPASDYQIDIKASVDRVYNLVCNWHQIEPLRRLSKVRAFNSLGRGSGFDYFTLELQDLPLKRTFCYGKRLFRAPFTLISMFVYRFFKAPGLNGDEQIETAIEQKWDDFFYQTTRLIPLDDGITRLLFLDSYGLQTEKKIEFYEQYFNEIRQLAESELIATGVDVVAEPADDEVFPDDDLADDEGDHERRETITYDIYDDYDPYRILGVNRNSDLNEIKQAYRRKAKQYHPDAQQFDYGHNEFVELTAAYHAILRELD